MYTRNLFVRIRNKKHRRSEKCTRVAVTNRPALGVHLAGINVRIDHNNLSVLLGKSFALVDGGCARQNVVAARSLAVQQVAIAAHLSAHAATEISRFGTLHSRRVALPLQFTLRASAPHDSYPVIPLFASKFFFVYDYTICIYLSILLVFLVDYATDDGEIFPQNF